MTTATVTSKGQITIPIAVREALHVSKIGRAHV
jgi:AbrB family looped-hinge helix DNA binding protein